MDGTTLQSLFSQGNPFLAQMGEQAFNLDQNTKQQTLADLVQKNQQSAASFPLDQQVKQSQIEHTKGLTRQANATAATTEDALGVLKSIPMDTRVQKHVSDIMAGISGNDKTMMADKFTQLGGYTALAMKNGGTLPLPAMTELQQKHPEFVQYFQSPQGLKLAANAVTAFNQLQPAYQQAIDTAKEHTRAAVSSASIGANASILNNRESIAAGKYMKPWMAGFDAKIDLEHDPAKKQAMLIDAASKAQKEDDKAAYTAYMERAQNLDNAVKLQRNAAQKEGTVRIGEMSGGAVPVQAPQSAMPDRQPQQAALPPEAVKQLQPGKKTTFRNGQVWTVDGQGQPQRIQ